MSGRPLEIAASLTQPETAEELRATLGSPAMAQVLADVVAPLLAPGAPAPTFQCRRVKCKPGRKLTVTYDVVVGPGPARPLTAMWFAGGGGGAGEAFGPGGDATADDVGPDPFRRLASWVPELGLLVQVSPHDPAFPQLARLVDPGHIAPLLERMLGPHPDGGDHVRITTVRYRPGQRHVLRYEQDGRPAVYAKLHRGEGERTAVVGGDIAGAVAGHGVEVATPAAVLDDEGVVLTAGRSGTPLSTLLLRDRAVGPHLRRLARLGAALRALHSAPAAGLASVPAERTLAGELAVTARASQVVAALLPDVGLQVDAILERLGGADGERPLPVLVHGDLKADHLLVDGDRLTLLDLDSAARAEPALDLGKFLADLRFALGSDGPSVAAAQDAFLAGYGRDRFPAERARWFEAVFLIRAAARRLPITDPSWATGVAALVDQAAVVLGERERVA